MGAVENFHLALFVGCNIVGKDHVKARLVGWESFLYKGFILKHPKVEYLALNYVIVVIARFLTNFLCRIAGITGNDSVHEG